MILQSKAWIRSSDEMFVLLLHMRSQVVLSGVFFAAMTFELLICLMNASLMPENSIDFCG